MQNLHPTPMKTTFATTNFFADCKLKILGTEAWIYWMT